MKKNYHFLRRSRLFILSIATLLTAQVNAQVSAYSFTSTAGTYTAITGTDLFGATWNDNVSASIALGFNFQFNAVSYSSVTVSSNGFVTFGSTAPNATNYTPVSNNAGYSGAISGFGKDLSAGTGTLTPSISYTVTGVAPNQKFIIQWQNAQRVAGDAVNFQIILNQTTNRIDVVYGNSSTSSTSNNNKVQVGLRGASNADFNNRSGGNGTAWTALSAGTANSDNVNFKSTVYPASGLTFSWLAPSCYPTSGTTISGITTTSGTFTWTSASGTNFDVYYGPSPLTVPTASTAPTASTTSTSYTATGLTPGTNYDVYVRNNCGAGNTSAWTPVTSFATNCNATNIPYVQDFESVTDPALPICTSAQNVGSGNTWITDSPSSNGFNSHTLTYPYNTTSTANTWFYTQGLNLTAGVSYRLSYRYGCYDGVSYVEKFRVSYGTSPINTAMTTTLTNHPNVTNDVTPITTYIDFTPATTGVFYIGFRCYSATDQYYLYVDDITVNLTPTCLDPTASVAAASTATTAVATWTAAGTATAWDVYYGPTPLTAPSASTVPTATASSTSYTLNGLMPSTGYAFYVRSHCSASDQSVWVGPNSFFTPCLPPDITSTTPATRCGIGTATLSATSAGTLNWYTAATGGTAVATGSVFTTPSISSTTNYYVSSSGAPSMITGGLLSPPPATSVSTTPYGEGLYFDIAQTCTLVSVDVYPDGPSDDVEIDIYDGNYDLVNYYTLTMPAGTGSTAVTVPINQVLPIGTDYHMEVYTASGTSLTYNAGGLSYPYALGGLGNITSGFDGFGTDGNDYFYVYNWKLSSICEGPRVMVTATVTAPPALTASTGTTVCGNVISPINVTSTLANYNTYVWSPVAGLYTDASATTPYTGGSTNSLYFKYNVNGPQTYTVSGNNTSTQCANIASTTMMVDVPVIKAVVSPTLLCSGSSATLNAMPVNSGTVSLGSGGSTTSGNGGSGGDYISPYSHYFGGYKAQYILRASELTAAGLYMGNITSLGFNVVSAGTTYPDFSIKMAATTQSVASGSSFTGSIPQVYGLNNVTPVVGINTYVFSTPFNWDGSSNVIVEVTWSENNTGGNAAEVKYDNTSYASTAYARDDNQTSAAMAAVMIPDGTNNSRPQIILGGQTPVTGPGTYTWQWNPGAVNTYTAIVSPTSTISTTLNYTVNVTNPATTCTNSAVVSLTVNPTPTVTLSASTASLCSGTSATLTANGASTFTWMPAGGAAPIAVVSPSATTVYSVTGTSLGCSNTKTVSLNVTASPTVIASASPVVICSGATTSLTASGAGTYSWSPLSSTLGTVTATPTVSTIYTVTGTTSNCTNTKTVSVTVNTIPTLTLTTNPSGGALCTTGATATLSATGTSTAYAWSNGANTATTSVAPTVTTVYTVTGTNSCGTKTGTTTVAVATTPTIAATSASTLSCANSSVVLTANATPGVSYTWNTGATTMSVAVTPSMTTTYTVTAMNACGTATASIVQNVSACTGIEEIVNAGDISIYPNPANDRVNIAIPANLTSAHTTVEVTDALGKVVMKEFLNTDVTTIQMNKLEDGVYFFKVTSNNQIIKVGKVVKN